MNTTEELELCDRCFESGDYEGATANLDDGTPLCAMCFEDVKSSAGC